MNLEELSTPLLVVFILVGIATFIVGMNMMSSGLKKAAGKGVKRFFKKTKNNRLANLGVGAGVTAIIQSSAATSVMAIGFINAGVMGVTQGVATMMGAYIGTTTTGIIASLSTFPFSSYLMLLAIVGVVMTFFKHEKVKAFGEVLTGLGLLFFGLSVLSSSFKVPVIKDAVSTAFTKISFPLLLMLVGIFVTALVQSSSATSGLVIALVGSGAVPFTSALYVVIGGTIGTFITTVIATIGSNTNAKRAGLIALFVKVIGGFLGLAVVWICDACNVIPEVSVESAPIVVAVFNLIFNIIEQAILLPFLTPFEKIANKVIKDKDEEKNKRAIKYIDNRMLQTPNVAMVQVKKEIDNMLRLSYENLKLGVDAIINQDSSHGKEINDREDSIDYLNKFITSFLISLSNKVDMKDESIIGSYFHVINDIERIGDHADNFFELTLKMKENDLTFSQIAKKELNSLNKIVMDMYDLTFLIFENEDKNLLKKLHELEDETDDLKRELSDAHFDRITKDECKVELTSYYSTLVSELERIADHLVNIGYSIVDPTGDEK